VGTGVSSARAEAGGSVVPPADSNPSGARDEEIPVPSRPQVKPSGASGTEPSEAEAQWGA